ncbi:MAG: hypothetical protein CMJ18_12240 [Phycisphaeraceae bacterium]|nr:hypothetical protein [Phycisphaeraceae bacterium]
MIVTVASVSLVGLAITAAPIIPERAKLPEELVSMSELTQLTLELRLLPEELRSAGVREEEVRRQIKTMLADAGMEVVAADERQIPGLRVAIEAGLERDLPDIVSLAVFIDIVQKVRVERLDRSLLLPTATVTHHEPKRLDQLDQAVRDFVGFTVRRFIDMQRLTRGKQ